MKVLAVFYNGSLKEKEFCVYRKNVPLFYVNEIVLLHNAMAKELGKAKIIRIERASLLSKSSYNVPKITDADAKAAGFRSLGHMRRMFDDSSNSVEPLYKITVRREE